ncbi:MAG: hypothetical protein ACO305_05545 [Rubrivivax sp.]
MVRVAQWLQPWVCAAAWVGLTLALGGCGGGSAADAGDTLFGGGNGSAPAAPTLTLTLDRSSISSALPGEVTATLKDAEGRAVAGEVVSFTVPGGLAVTNVATALSNEQGLARVVLSPASPSGAGAGTLEARTNVGLSELRRSIGFQVNATTVNLGFAPLASGFVLAEYGQATLTLRLDGASTLAPVSVSVTSPCIDQGKAELSPASFTATASSVEVQYRDKGCGALQRSDEITAAVVGSAQSARLTLSLSRPGVSSLAFIQAQPEVLYLKGSGTESAELVFEVRDASGNPLANETVDFALQTGAGGVRLNDQPADVITQARSGADGRVIARVNSGTVPTAVRVRASIALSPTETVSTVSSNLGIAVGLPAQRNFSLAQQTINIEGMDRDGTPNVYTVRAADRSGNPVPPGTSINFVAEGGQIEGVKQITLSNGLAVAPVNFFSQQPKPADGRITVTAYAFGEESFIDLNGNNVHDPGEPFQDLGDVFEDFNFDGAFDAAVEPVRAPASLTSSCTPIPTDHLATLALDPSTPTTGGSRCDGAWTGQGRVSVRRAIETVLSHSQGHLLWASTGSGPVGLDRDCRAGESRPTGPSSSQTFRRLTGENLWHASGDSGTLSLYVADVNPNRLNPMAAGTVISATSATRGLSVSVAGSPVPSTSHPSAVAVSFQFDATASQGVIQIELRSPSGTTTLYSQPVSILSRATTCPP